MARPDAKPCPARKGKLNKIISAIAQASTICICEAYELMKVAQNLESTLVIKLNCSEYMDLCVAEPHLLQTRSMGQPMLMSTKSTSRCSSSS